jgi:hypothetical protein
MQHGAFGTLGVICSVKFRLMPVRRFVQLKYERVRSMGEFLATAEALAADDSVDFIDGFVHGPTSFVLNVGRLCDEAPYTHRWKLRAYCPSTARRHEDFMGLADYFFRYDHGVTRMHPILSSTQLLMLAKRAAWLLPKRPSVTVDVFVPFSRVERFFDWYRRTFDFFPVWCVPYRRVRDYEWLSRRFYTGMKDALFLDLAIYGMKQRPGQNAYRELERGLQDVGGVKTLISHNYYSAEEFWQIWNRQNYERAKALVDPSSLFGDLYTKTCQAA